MTYIGGVCYNGHYDRKTKLNFEIKILYMGESEKNQMRARFERHLLRMLICFVLAFSVTLSNFSIIDMSLQVEAA